MAQGMIRYRCFLPDLTGFTVPPCTGPDYQQSTSTLEIVIRRSRIADRASVAIVHYLPSSILDLQSSILESSCGGEGGIRTPGTLIRGTHDFQTRFCLTYNNRLTISTGRNRSPLPVRLLVFGLRCPSNPHKTCTMIRVKKRSVS